MDKNEFSVEVPQLPDEDNPRLLTQLPFALSKFSFDSDTILIGHSSGCPLILSVLENIDTKIHRAILVAGFASSLDGSENPILQEEYNWDKIKNNCNRFVFINSVDDPWGANDAKGREMFDRLGGELILRSDQGHMGSDSFNQPYKEFELLKLIIEAKL